MTRRRIPCVRGACPGSHPLKGFPCSSLRRRIAAEVVARAAPDGYTLLMQSMSHAITPALYKLPYDTLKDFTPVSLFVQSPSILAVHPSLPVKTVKDLIAFTKKHPDEILFSSSGTGSGQHLTMELLNRMAGLQFVHIPYKGTAPSILDLVAGRVSVTSASAISTIPPLPRPAFPDSRWTSGTQCLDRPACRKKSSPSSMQKLPGPSPIRKSASVC